MNGILSPHLTTSLAALCTVRCDRDGFSYPIHDIRLSRRLRGQYVHVLKPVLSNLSELAFDFLSLGTCLPRNREDAGHATRRAQSRGCIAVL